MKADTTDFDTVDSCPQCGENTHVIKVGAEPAREVCVSIKCGDWDGVTLQ